MHRYHFNSFDGQTQIDHTGTMSPSPYEARVEAIRLAGALLGSSPKTVKDVWSLRVTREEGSLLSSSNSES